MDSDSRTILVCRCSNAARIDEATREAIDEAADSAADTITITDDLCALTAAKDPSLQRLVQSQRLTVLACHPRAIRWMLQSIGAAVPDDAELIDLTTEDAAAHVREHLGQGGRSASKLNLPTSPAGAWFPVVDRGRCNDCGQCANFCLFGVYAFDTGGVRVVHPENCKPGCPACARVCPQGAVIFPKHEDPAVHGRLQPTDGKTSLQDVLAGDVYEALRHRSITQADVQRGLAERAQCCTNIESSCCESDGASCGCAGDDVMCDCDCNCDCGDDDC